MLTSRFVRTGAFVLRTTNSEICLNQNHNKQISKRYYASEPEVIVEKLKGITTIGINRPEKRNCVNVETARRLREAFENFENDSEATVAVLYGKGGCFSAGLDLKEVSEKPEEYEFIYNPASKNGAGPMGPSRHKFFSKPVIAGIAGYAVAGGMELTLMCDMRVMEETAVMGIFCRRFGVPLIDGGTVRLPHLIGLSRALDLIITGRGVNGIEAHSMGLVNQVVACGTGVGQAVNLATSIVKFPQECLNRDRLSAYEAMYNSSSFEEAIKLELERGNDIIRKESVKGATDFVNGVGRHGSFNLTTSSNRKLYF